MDEEIKEEIVLPMEDSEEKLDPESPASRWIGDIERVQGERPAPFVGSHGEVKITEKGKLDLRSIKFIDLQEIPVFIEYLINTYGYHG